LFQVSGGQARGLGSLVSCGPDATQVSLGLWPRVPTTFASSASDIFPSPASAAGIIRFVRLKPGKTQSSATTARFGACANNWVERDGLLAFVAEIKNRIDAEGDTTVGGRPLTEWLAWAEGRIASLDPFSGGVAGLFEAISR